jgi:polysaccharide export outer membrane protein
MRSLLNFCAFFAVVVLLSSCVGNKRVVLVQNKDLKNRKDIPVDTVLRHYNPIPYDYKIQPMDILSIRFESLTPTEYDFFNSHNQGNISVMGNPVAVALLGEMVNPEGEVKYPVIGAVKVAGLSIFEIQDKLQTLADEFLESPKVIVRLVNFRITVLGEVARENQVVLTNNRANILEAIALSGGLGELADRTKIKLIRQQGNDVTIQYINLLDENIINSPYYYVHQNDVIVVPPLSQRAFRRYFGSNLGLITSSISILLLVLNFANK